MSDDLRKAAQAVLDRWDSPKWEWISHGPTADLMTALRAALAAAQPPAAMPGTPVLPDGSAFFTASLPLPKDHWLYAPRCAEWDNERDTTADTPHPILNNSHLHAVIAAIRYAVRGATMCGQEMDFDPDALALNAAYALCGPATGRVLAADRAQAQSVPATGAQPWQPIETAPRDGRKIIVAYVNRNSKVRTVMARWMTDEQAAETDSDGVGLEGGWYECIDNWDDYTEVAIHEGEPEHWMPLPTAPTGSATPQGDSNG